MKASEIVILATGISFVLSAGLCPIVIPILKRMKFGQFIREEGPKSHLSKSGTPTMGGIIFLVAILATSLIFIFALKDYSYVPVLCLTMGFGLIGFIDDILKIIRKQNEGLSEIQKMLGQIIVAALFVFYLVRNVGTSIIIPFVKVQGHHLEWEMPVWLFAIFMFIVIIGTVNGANFTDGLDGLATSVTIIIAIFFIGITRQSGLVIYNSAVLGALMGFLLYNVHPARVFMGDTGSLALGGFVAGMACILRMPLIILIVAFIYLIEVISVMIQVGWFKITKKKYGEGRRIFRMAPLHHHFQEGGKSETQVVTYFTVFTIILCMLGYLAVR